MEIGLFQNPYALVLWFLVFISCHNALIILALVSTLSPCSFNHNEQMKAGDIVVHIAPFLVAVT